MYCFGEKIPDRVFSCFHLKLVNNVLSIQYIVLVYLNTVGIHLNFLVYLNTVGIVTRGFG